MTALRNLLFNITFIILTACASTSYHDIASQIVIPNSTIKPLLYGDLVSTAEGWRIRNIKQDPIGDVKLGSMEPASIDRFDRSACSRGLLGLTEGDCYGLESEWLEYTPTKGVYALPIIWPLGLAFSTLVPFAAAVNEEPLEVIGKLPILIFPIPLRQKFNWDTYIEVISEARSAESFDAKYPDITNRVKELLESINTKKYTKLPFNNTTETQALIDKLYNDKFRQVSNIAMDNVTLKIVDQSEVYHQPKLQPKYFLDIKPQLSTIKPILISPTIKEKINEELVLELLFPADDLTDLEGNISLSNNRLEEIRLENKKISIHNNHHLTIANTHNKNLLNQFVSELRSEKSEVVWKQKKSIEYLLKNIHYTFEVPSNSIVESGKLTAIPEATLTITGVDFNNVMPTAYSSQNSRLKLHLNDKLFTIENISSEYIFVDAVSLIYKSESLVNDAAGFEYLYKLSPGSSKKIYLTTFDLAKLDRSFNNVTRDSAKNTVVNFGFDLSYRTSEEGKSTTFHAPKPYLLIDLI